MTLPISPAAGLASSEPPAAGAPLRITVYGTPAPQGSKRHVGHGVMIESSKKVKPWREAVKHAALDVRGTTPPLDGPLQIHIFFTVAKPASAPKRRVTFPAKRPDIDKLLRSSFDALGEAGVWLDDAQVVTVLAQKVYPGEAPTALDTPGARIIVHRIEP